MLHVLLNSHINSYMYYIKARINVLELYHYKKKLNVHDHRSNIRRNVSNYPINSRFKHGLTICGISCYIIIARFQILRRLILYTVHLVKMYLVLVFP
jgi:hypothetical protein